jgi:predicted GNAT superfamily acetyltransferase
MAIMVAGNRAGSSPPSLRPLESHEDLERCVALQRATWGDGFRELVPPAMLLVAQKVGGILVGAFAADDQLVGFVFGITGWLDRRPVHWSHMMAVRPDQRDHGIGRRLKAEQRRRLLAAGVDRAQWTFDPLVSRNAFLNLERLGIRVLTYVPDMYGENPMSKTDSVIGSDRFLVEWDLRRSLPSAPRAAIPVATGPLVTESLDPDASLPEQPVVRVGVPRDIQDIKGANPDLARRWRARTRTAFVHYLGSGYEIRGFGRDADGGGWYQLEHRTHGRD